MDELEEIKATFFQECDELLGDLEAGLLNMEVGAGDGETVNAVFRAVHSVKGGAGAFGLDALVRYAHVFETLLENVRSDRVEATAELVRVLLRAADVLADEVQAARTDGSADELETADMVAELELWISGGPSAVSAPRPVVSAPKPAPAPVVESEDEDFGFTPMTVSIPDIPELPDLAPASGGWTIRFAPAASLYAKANEAGLLLRELGRLGPIEVELDDDSVPPLDALDPNEAYLAWNIKLGGDVDEAAIREVFEFVDGDCELTIEQAGAPDLAALIAAVSAQPEPAFEPMVTAPPPLAAPEEPALMAEASRDEHPAARTTLRAGGEAVPAAQATIRVDPERIDRLIDLVGELVINQAMLAQRVVQHGFAPSSDIAMGLDELEQLTRGIQDSVMAIRAQPVKSVFQRMPRLAREVAAQVSKLVRLVMEGEGTEVDKTVIERLSDPITHMLRNAIDHGIETPAERVAAGKPAEGTVRLIALHRGGRIVIEVHDDGRGINRGRVRQIAIDKGLIAADAVLSDDEVDNLIFLPGFSTANAVSDISGRGVGMDVVRRSVQALGGRISISSRPGEGSTFTLSLPLTLAVLDGMVVDVAGHTLVVPLTSIIESLRPKPEEVRPLGPQGAVLAVRGSYVPLVDVGSVLGFRQTSISPTEGVVLLVEPEDGSRAALVADVIQGQRQVVIKSLEANYRQVEGIAAATILGDGRVALIVDVDAVVAMRRRDLLAGEARVPETTLHAAE